METMFVKPKAGLVLRRPDSGAVLSAEGARVPKNSFWMRRLADGDVVESEVKEEKQMDVEAQAAPEAMQAEERSTKKGGKQ